MRVNPSWLAGEDALKRRGPRQPRQAADLGLTPSRVTWADFPSDSKHVTEPGQLYAREWAVPVQIPDPQNHEPIPCCGFELLNFGVFCYGAKGNGNCGLSQSGQILPSCHSGCRTQACHQCSAQGISENLQAPAANTQSKLFFPTLPRVLWGEAGTLAASWATLKGTEEEIMWKVYRRLHKNEVRALINVSVTLLWTSHHLQTCRIIHVINLLGYLRHWT